MPETMPEIIINNDSLTALAGKVIVVTGCASGIGLATVKLLIHNGAFVVAGDIQPPKEDMSLVATSFMFQKTDVTDWDQLKALFKRAITYHGRIDHVFANAGVAPQTSFVAGDVDDQGDPKRPHHGVLNVNLVAVVDTVKLAVHYLKWNPRGGSIVLTASASSYQTFTLTEYTTAKHGVLGLMRGLTKQLHPTIPIRLNCIAPAWTATGLVNTEAAAKAGVPLQQPEAVARSVALLMADQTRHGQLIFSSRNRYTEIEGDLLAAAANITKDAAGIEPGDHSLEEERGMIFVAMGRNAV